VLAHPTGLPVEEPWYLISNAEPALDLVWSYGRRFCCEQLFRDQKSGVFRLEDSGLRDPQRIDRLLLVIAIAVLTSSLQGYALSLAGLRRQVDPHWKRGYELSAAGPACSADARLRRNRQVDGLAADPAAGARTLHPKPQGTAQAGADLVLQG
jgi:hypothetical protein